jgi:hypothetical protein
MPTKNRGRGVRLIFRPLLNGTTINKITEGQPNPLLATSDLPVGYSLAPSDSQAETSSFEPQVLSCQFAAAGNQDLSLDQTGKDWSWALKTKALRFQAIVEVHPWALRSYAAVRHPNPG